MALFFPNFCVFFAKYNEKVFVFSKLKGTGSSKGIIYGDVWSHASVMALSCWPLVESMTAG